MLNYVIEFQLACIDSPEEGEIRIPRYPHSSPPPEEEWRPCIRAYVSDSKTLPVGAVYVITQAGAIFGRYVIHSEKWEAFPVYRFELSLCKIEISRDKM